MPRTAAQVWNEGTAGDGNLEVLNRKVTDLCSYQDATIRNEEKISARIHTLDLENNNNKVVERTSEQLKQWSFS